MPADVRPYLVPGPGCVEFGSWSRWDGEAWTPAEDALVGWDPGTDVLLRRSVAVDRERLWQETRLPAGIRIAFAVSWKSHTSGMTERAALAPLAESGPLNLEAVLPGARIGGTVRVRTTLSLGAANYAPNVGAAHMVGSVLSEDLHDLDVEGTSRSFPIHDVDFSHTELGADASWHLETSDDLAGPFFGDFRLLINRRDSELLAALRQPRPDGRQALLLDQVEHGVRTLMLELAMLLRDELATGEPWPTDSTGHVLARLLFVAGGESLPGPTGAVDLSDFRTRLDSLARASGHGRRFT